MALLSDNAEAAGLDLAFASALVSLAWAGGQVIGGSGWLGSPTRPPTPGLRFDRRAVRAHPERGGAPPGATGCRWGRRVAKPRMGAESTEAENEGGRAARSRRHCCWCSSSATSSAAASTRWSARSAPRSAARSGRRSCVALVLAAVHGRLLRGAGHQVPAGGRGGALRLTGPSTTAPHLHRRLRRGRVRDHLGERARARLRRRLPEPSSSTSRWWSARSRSSRWSRWSTSRHPSRSKLNVVLTLVEIGGLVLIVLIAASSRSSTAARRPGARVRVQGGREPAVAILAGAALAFYALVGFEDSVNVAEETKSPSRTYPWPSSAASGSPALIYLRGHGRRLVAVPTGRPRRLQRPAARGRRAGPARRSRRRCSRRSACWRSPTER